MADWSVRRQQEIERRERLARVQERERLEGERLAAERREQQRIANLKNQWASITAACANSVLAAYHLASYQAKARRLIDLFGD